MCSGQLWLSSGQLWLSKGGLCFFFSFFMRVTSGLLEGLVLSVIVLQFRTAGDYHCPVH